MKTVMFAFRGDPMCFIHVMLNALDMQARGDDVKIVLEGEAVRLIQEMQEAQNPMFATLIDEGLIAGVCKACSAKMGVLQYNEQSGIPLLDEMKGHPAMRPYLDAGYTLLTF